MSLFNKKPTEAPKKMRYFLVNYTAHFKTLAVNVMQRVKQDTFINEMKFERDMAQMWFAQQKTKMLGSTINNIIELSEDDFNEYTRESKIIDIPKPKLIVP